MNTTVLPDPGAEATSAQLFRYAQDLQELMRQHSRLLSHHQMVMQSLGQQVHDDNLLPQLLTQAQLLHWVTDSKGKVLRSVRQDTGSGALHVGVTDGANLLNLVDPSQQEVLRAQLQHMADLGPKACTVQLLVHLAPSEELPQGLALDALLMPVRQGVSQEVAWFLHPAAPPEATDLQALTPFVHAMAPGHALIATNPHGSISAVSQGYCRTTGYSAVELIGKNPRMLASGHHNTGFYQDLWLELLDTGSWNGTIFNRRKDGQIFLQWQTIRMVTDLHGQVLAYLSASIDLSYTTPSAKRLESIAYTDPLTGLPNRRMLTDRLTLALEAAQPQEQALALLFIDLDRFKPINDELGHAVGDLVLQEVARRMRQALLPGDLLARVGGDEFVVLLSGPLRAAVAETVGAHIQNALAPPMRLQNCQLSLGASIGCARYPQHGRDMLTLLQRADAAMYGAKRFGIPFCHYDEGMDEGGGHNLEFDLWQALDRNEISLVYQPQVCNNEAQTLRGVEALMRWKHPVLGDIDPVQFIGLAERSGAIVPLGNWAIAHACAQLRRWRDQGLPEFTLSLNISLRQLRHPGLLAEVQQALFTNRLDGHHLEMEFSESQAMLFMQSDTRHVQALRELGVRIAIDDYGISFSSLSRLNFLTISSFKLSQHCVQDLANSADARAVSKCMIAISKVMGIEVIAQGVETQAQAQVLAQQGCHVLQGFYTGHPVPADVLGQMLWPA